MSTGELIFLIVIGVFFLSPFIMIGLMHLMIWDMNRGTNKIFKEIDKLRNDIVLYEKNKKNLEKKKKQQEREEKLKKINNLKQM